MTRRIRAAVANPKSPTEVEFIPDAVVSVEGERIASVEPFDGGEVDTDHTGCVLVPGFVDSHLHYPQTRIVGSASGPLLEWLEKSTFPEEARFADVGHAAEVAATFCSRLAAAGTTLSLAYGSSHQAATEILMQAADRRGMRMITGPVLMDEHCPEELQVAVGPAMEALEDLAERWHGREGRVELAVIPRFALSCSRKMMEAAAEMAEKHGLIATTHLSENLDECRMATERFGTEDYLSIYEQTGLLREGAVFAHCIHLSDSEWDRFAAAKAVVAHCPDSNDFLGSGGMPIGKVMERNIAMSIGTDLAAGRSFRIPRILASAYDNALRQKLTLHPTQLLWWGTRGGAQALGKSELGGVEAGMAADFAVFRMPRWAESLEQVLAALLLDHDLGGSVETFVAGRRVWRAP